MRKIMTRLAVASGVAALATVALTGPAYADEDRSGGAVTCESGQAVEFSAIITDGFLSTKFTWIRTPGAVPRTYGQSSGRVVTWNTGEQSIDSWSAYTEASFVNLTVACRA
ncbi:hypothetical protein [Actinoplanes sp. NPDC049265]|uniref:hypothetical protein n=1 Tax=Actinoplanes sp. NPDC049265 TaxID=3363902 RepID=UPI003719806D